MTIGQMSCYRTGQLINSQQPIRNLLRGWNKAFIVAGMFATIVFSILFLAFSGALIARLPLRAKLLLLLRRAR